MKRRFRDILLWLVPALVALPLATALDRRVEAASSVDGAESAAVERALEVEFGSPFARTAALVLPGIRNADSDGGRARVRSIVARFEDLPFVTAVASPATSLDTLLVGNGGTGVLAIVGIAATDPAAAIDALRAITADIPEEALWTGRVALETDLRRAGAQETRRSELRAIPPSLLLAVWAFGGVAGAISGVAAGVLSVLFALALTGLVSFVLPVTVIAPVVASIVGLAVGIDYTLLVMTEYRSLQPTARGGGAGVATGAMTRTGTIRTAALAAAAGFAPLLFVPVSELRSAGVAALAAVTAAALVALAKARQSPTGEEDRRASWRGTRSRHGAVSTPKGAGLLESTVRAVVRQPVLALTLSLTPLLFLGASAGRMRAALHDVQSLPRTMESVEALERLADMGRAEAAVGLRAIVTMPAGTSVFDSRGWEALARVERELRSDRRIADVRSIRTVSGGIPAADVRAVFPETSLRAFTSRDESSALIEIVPGHGTDAGVAAALVRDLRRLHDGEGIRIGGVLAHSIDYADTIASHAGPAIGLAVVSVFAVLLVAFRSVMVAVKAVLLNLLTAFAAIGATVLVFQDGIAALSVGSTSTAGIFATVPLLAFCAVFAVGIDYEVFLLARIFAERANGESDEEAIVRGVASSARLITRAAAIMIVVFMAFALGDFIVIRMIGFALAVAVAIDATLVRLVIAPALMRIAGQWNWWPGERWPATRRHSTRTRAIQPVP